MVESEDYEDDGQEPDVEAEDCQYDCTGTADDMEWSLDQHCWICGECRRPQ